MIVSIDVALKSLAICIIDVSTENDISVFDINSPETYKNINILYNFTENLCTHKKVKELSNLDIVRLISTFINNKIIPIIDAAVGKNQHSMLTILIEKQISGTQTYISFITLLTLLQNYNIKIINPGFKNKLEIGGFTIVDGYKKTTNSYLANKHHSRLMFLYLSEFVNGKIKYDKKMETDIADCYCQLFYWLSVN